MRKAMGILLCNATGQNAPPSLKLSAPNNPAKPSNPSQRTPSSPTPQPASGPAPQRMPFFPQSLRTTQPLPAAPHRRLPRPKSKLQSRSPNQTYPPRTRRRSTRSKPWFPTACRPCAPCPSRSGRRPLLRGNRCFQALASWRTGSTTSCGRAMRRSCNCYAISWFSSSCRGL
ncbi:RNA_pol_I_A49 superfamily domain-containing protein [Histoplasma capsulatum G186AR]|uniref:RNA_pol_I_A49 superfamily domain-containing protein n=1 Tax=Ajellomyces capsulatus TaxID=5037 RepID=A0A8H7YPZ2_AJECA|nr:RNA_pol_I_A49 superfamily domain-containing protein [Histoplasma capsulatum]QSS74908.1 RNA_pol_I_A49 superfamily domain-containing protein [Histoplasma capsulatum G186AR]